MTEITKPEKFLFTLSFDDEVNNGGKEEEPSYSQEEYEAARKESYDAGFGAGQKAAKEEEAQHMGVLLEDVGRKLEHMTKTSNDVWEEQLRELQQTSLVIMRKIMPSYVEAHGKEEVHALIERVITEMAHEPRLVFRVAPDHFKEFEARINELCKTHAFSGEVIVLEDDTLGRSDCRIEWMNGGLERDLKSLWRSLDRVLEANLGLEEGALTEEALASSEEEEALEEQEAASQEEKLQSEEPEEKGDEEKLELQTPDIAPEKNEGNTSDEVTLEESQTGDGNE